MNRRHRRWAGLLWALVTAGAVATFTVAVVLELPTTTRVEGR